MRRLGPLTGPAPIPAPGAVSTGAWFLLAAGHSRRGAFWVNGWSRLDPCKHLSHKRHHAGAALGGPSLGHGPAESGGAEEPTGSRGAGGGAPRCERTRRARQGIAAVTVHGATPSAKLLRLAAYRCLARVPAIERMSIVLAGPRPCRQDWPGAECDRGQGCAMRESGMSRTSISRDEPATPWGRSLGAQSKPQSLSQT